MRANQFIKEGVNRDPGKLEVNEETGADHVARYLNDLVVSGNVSASTQNQALNAPIFLYKQVLRAPLGQLENFARSKRK